MLGIGVMLSHLGGNEESVHAFKNSIGKEISSLVLGEDDALHIGFTDGSKIGIYDAGQSCCESRYMRTDDDLQSFIGGVLLSGEVKEAPNQEDEYGEHEVEFLELMTSKGALTMASHNEHNGYYGGFSIRVRTEP